MVLKAKKGLYDNLSRKELQSICRLYGLPPNKKSLISFLEEGINGSISNFHKASHSKCLSFSKENVFRPESEGSKVVESFSSSTFELYVRSEDGLNLYVDLNSSLSDWTKKFKREIHILEHNGNDDVLQSKSWSLHDDLPRPKDYENELRSSEENFHRDGPEIVVLDPFSADVSMESQPRSCREISEADFCPIEIQPEERKFTDDESFLQIPRFDSEPVADFESSHLPVSAQEGERSNVLNEREISECSQFTKTFENGCFDSGNLESNGGQQKKRKRIEAEHQSDYARPNVKILRSMKRKKDLPRRSMRLMSKSTVLAKIIKLRKTKKKKKLNVRWSSRFNLMCSIRNPKHIVSGN